MNEKESIEKRVSAAFDSQAKLFDKIYIPNEIIAYKRNRVRTHLASFLSAGSTILELNCGTGEDSIYLAENGHTVHATDLSGKMLDILKNKIEKKHSKGQITFENISFHDLDKLKNKGPYDLIFSNFGGLNCTDRLDQVLSSFDSLLKPGGIICIVIISRFCLWESLMLFRGKFKTAFRRFFASRGRKAHIEGHYFQCWYYSPAYIKKHLKHYNTLSMEGLCSIVPPSYIENFTEKHPFLFKYLEQKENKWKAMWPWRSIGDYFIITLKKS